MTNPAVRLEKIRAQHTKSYATSGDEAWVRNPICAEDGHAWPCPVAEVLELVGAEAAHRINPVIGWIRLVDHHADYQNPQHEKFVDNSIERLVETVNFFRKDI